MDATEGALYIEEQKVIYWFSKLDSTHNGLVGRKCANLGAMLRVGLPFLPGFAISIFAYEKFLEETGAGREICEISSGREN